MCDTNNKGVIPIAENFNKTSDYVRWSVMWKALTKSGEERIIEHEFENDLSGALELYAKVVRAGKPWATLRSQNMPFPPPHKYRARTMIKSKRVRRNGKIKTQREEIWVDPMRSVNLKGIWWCPYCVRMRKFQKQDGAFYEGTFVPNPAYYCPMCGISHRDHYVRKFNPKAQEIDFKLATRRPRARPVKPKRRRSR